jgi:hypothetical protein
MKTRFASLSLAALGVVCAAQVASAQLIPVKTIPIAESEQFAFFPSSGRNTMSMLLADSLLDPFTNPAKGGYLARSQYFGAPSFFSVTDNAGGGTTFPMGGFWKRGNSFAGAALAYQQIDRVNELGSGFFGPEFVSLSSVAPGPLPQEQQAPKANRYAYAMFGRSLDSARFTIGASVLWSNLRSVDGTDLLYDGNLSLSQLGDAVDIRLGATRTLRGGRTIEAMVLRSRFATSHEVGFMELFWDPGSRATRTRARTELNGERSDVWGAHLEYEHPLDSGWRVGALATTNLIRHPRIPSYAITSGLGSIGRATAYNVGGGVGRVTSRTSFGVDAIYEPIVNESWIRDTVDNRFDFTNARLRGGVSRDFPMVTPGNAVRLQAGAEYHWINYRLRQDDHVNGVTRRQREHWLERSRSGGVSFITPGLQMHYLVTAKNGVGRPGVVSDNGSLATPDVISIAPWGGPTVAPMVLGSVSMTRHVFSISVPVR